VPKTLADIIAQVMIVGDLRSIALDNRRREREAGNGDS
jgi:hypothetical protein